MSTEGRVTIANPGHLPWVVHTGAAFARVGRLGRYLAPLATTSGDLERLERLPAGLRARVAAEISRRKIPAELDPHVLRKATLTELAAVVGKRAGLPTRLQRASAELRDAQFDRAVARALDGSEAALFTAYNAAVHSIRRARRIDVPTLIDYPVAHHAFAAEILNDEARRLPAYASTMQFHDAGPRRIARLEEELATADRVLALSTFHKQTFVDHGVPEERMVVNPFGVDCERFRPGTHSPRTTFRILFVGQLTQRKGLSYAIDAFRLAGIPDAELCLLGHPVGTVAPWKELPGVRHLPMVAPHEAPEVFRTADVFVLPSLVEGLARVVLEAMASGLPVIVTPNTGAEDVMVDGEHGFVVPIRDAEAIAERLRTLHDDPVQRLAMGRAARSQAERFTWEAYGRRMVATAQGIAS